MKTIQSILAVAIAVFTLSLTANNADARYAYYGNFTNVDIDTHNIMGGTIVTLKFNSTKSCTPKVSLYRTGAWVPAQVKTGKSGTSHYFSFLITDEFKEFYFKIQGVAGNRMLTKTTESFLSFGLGLGT